MTVGPDLTYNGGAEDGGVGDIFIAKLNAVTTAFLYCGYIGGAAHDYGNRIAVDKSGCACLVGWTDSAERHLPNGGRTGPDH